jgi:hypothetical protein
MKDSCEKWQNPLREAALTGTNTPELLAHLQTCANCSETLKDLEVRKARLDALLPMVARGSQPSADFRARVLAAAQTADEKKGIRPWRIWALTGASAALAVLVIVVALRRQTQSSVLPSELAAAQKLAEWRAPSDAFLATPGQDLLRTVPKLGQSYLHVPVKIASGEMR